MPLSSPHRNARSWPIRTWTLLLAALAAATLLIHGFHPFAEDGGLYAAGVDYTLDHSLFPHDTAFVTAHLRYSLFAPAVAALVRLIPLSLPAVLLLLAFLAAFLTLLAARAILRRCTPVPAAQFAGVALLTAGWTLPIAGTSLYLMDPYVTARSFCMPAALAALALALDDWPPLLRSRPFYHPGLRCLACLLMAAAFHPLIAAYAFLFVAAIRATRAPRPVRAWLLLAGCVFAACAVLNALAPSESPAETAAVVTRYYWFLSQWHVYEQLGLLGPPCMIALILWAHRAFPGEQLQPRQTLAWAAILLSGLYTACALLFAHEGSPSHLVARLQPLRGFLLLYAIMLVLLGDGLYRVSAIASARTSRLRRAALPAVPALVTLAMAAGLFTAARALYPASPQIEWPWRAALPQNPWVQAFQWTHANTPHDALFALDARYVNMPGEDAQYFRAFSLRSALPDYSKDGGEASITPSLAPAWLAGATAQHDLSALADSERDRRLQPFGVTWMLLQASAITAHRCPYRNTVVKVCRLQP